jgi:hypothetical protein
MSRCAKTVSSPIVATIGDVQVADNISAGTASECVKPQTNSNVARRVRTYCGKLSPAPLGRPVGLLTIFVTKLPDCPNTAVALPANCPEVQTSSSMSGHFTTTLVRRARQHKTHTTMTRRADKAAMENGALLRHINFTLAIWHPFAAMVHPIEAQE